MENEKKLSLGAIVTLIGIGALNILWIICDLIMFKDHLSFSVVLQILMFVSAAVYVLFAYRKPHGNLMKYLLLAYTLFGSIMFVQLCKFQETYMNIVDVVMIILMAYMAGRLDHFKQNIAICGIVLAKTLIVSINLITSMSSIGMLNFVTFFGCIGSTTCWLAISSAYILRYKEHREAGLADKE